MRRQILINAAVIAIAFGSFLVLSFPFDLVLAKLVYPRIEAATGVVISADSVGPGFPFSLVAKNVTLSSKSGRNLVGGKVPSIKFTPGFGMLLGKKNGDIDIKLPQGTIAATLSGDQVQLKMSEVGLSLIEVMSGATDWTADGKFDVEGTYDRKAATGNFAVTFKNVVLSGVSFLGIQFPKLDMTEARLGMKLAENRIEFLDARTTGGNVALNLAGLIALAPSFGNSTLSLVLYVTPTPEMESALGPSTAQVIAPIKKPDGSIEIAINGTVNTPQTGFR